MLIDDVTITIQAGKGGDGAVAFDKNKGSRGPVGGNGGKGGNVYVKGVSDLSQLSQFRYKKEIAAQNGKNGRGQFVDGSSAQDLVLNVPVGTVVHNLTHGRTQEIVAIGQRALVAKGGKGGKGNFLFRSSTNTTPKEFEYGQPGEQFTLRLELKLIADVGFIGLPNVGKSSLLNELTHAKANVANYPFTTLEPNLGAYYDIILADIPGLIEGAAKGKGLGVKFLRHIERTAVMFHFISAQSENPANDYKIIRKELALYSPALLKKQEYLFLSKSDAVDAAILKKKLASVKKLNSHTFAFSIYDETSVKKIKTILNKLAKTKHNKPWN